MKNMTGKKQKMVKSRRNFLRGSVIAGAGTVVASSLSTSAVASTSQELDEKPQKEGYRLTKHILDYYKSAAS
jgi:hypothetical protein